jgi:hypothetical protein
VVPLRETGLLWFSSAVRLFVGFKYTGIHKLNLCGGELFLSPLCLPRP